MPTLTARVDLQAIRDNLRVVRSLAGDRTVMACVKANAYGHGLVPVARCLEREGIGWLTLGSPEEALALREGGVRARILLFPTIPGLDLAPLARREITIGVQSSAEAAALARASGRRVSMFLKVDSGFGRVGVPLDDAVEEARRIGRRPSVALEGIFTHLPFSSAESVPWVAERLKAFGAAAAAIRAQGRAAVEVLVALTGRASYKYLPVTRKEART